MDQMSKSNDPIVQKSLLNDPLSDSAITVPDFRGNRVIVDLSQPFVLLKDCAHGFGKIDRKGVVVYPVEDGNQRSLSHERIPVSSLDEKNQYISLLRPGSDMVSLSEMIEVAGQAMGIALIKEGSVSRIIRDGEDIRLPEVVEELIEAYSMQKLPTVIRDSLAVSSVGPPEIREDRKGVVCDSLDDVFDQLRVISRGIVLAVNESNQQLTTNLRANIGSEKTNNVARSIKLNLGVKKPLVEQIIGEIASQGGKYERQFNYDAVGTEFFNAVVKVTPVGDKFVLEFTTSNQTAEKELAELSGKRRAFQGTRLSFPLEEVAPGWVGFDTTTIFGVENQQAAIAAAKSAANECFNKISFQYLDISISISTNVIGKLFETPPEVLRVDGTKFYFPIQEGNVPTVNIYISKRGEVAVSASDEARLLEVRNLVNACVVGESVAPVAGSSEYQVA